jgi:hypothetical protein
METTEKRLRELIFEEIREATAERDMVREIAGRTESGAQGGWRGVWAYAKEGSEFLDSLAGKFGSDDVPEELEQASKRFELILGSAKLAFVRDNAAGWSVSNPEEMAQLKKRHLVSQYEGKEEG